MKQQGSDTFGDITVRWLCNSQDNYCDVEAFWKSSKFLEDTLTLRKIRLPFSISDEQQSAAGEFYLTIENRMLTQLNLNLQQNEHPNQRYTLWPTQTPTPPPPPPLIDDCSDDIVNEHITPITDDFSMHFPSHDLFPYLYIQPWPTVTEQDIDNRFIHYTAVCDNADTNNNESFYCQVVAIQQDRSAVRQLAVNFINQDNQFISDLAELSCPVVTFNQLDSWLRNHPKTELPVFIERVIAVFSACDISIVTWQDVLLTIQTPEYLQEIEQVWQSLFALAITAGYKTQLLEAFIRILDIATLLDRLAVYTLPPVASHNDETTETIDLTDTLENDQTIDNATIDPTIWTPEVLHQAACASIVLPVAISPSASNTEPAPSTILTNLANEASKPMMSNADELIIEPLVQSYALGQLHITRQKLLRYELGEVSAIESVLIGETKEATQRSLQRTEAESMQIHDYLEQASQNLSIDNEDGWQKGMQALQLDLEASFDSSYGPITGGQPTASSTLSIVPNSTSVPGQSQAQFKLNNRDNQFAKTMTEKMAQSISRSIQKMRSVHALNEQEETVTHRIEGQYASENIRAIYRWVNKIYQTWSENYGQRLIIECIVPTPATHYINSSDELNGINLTLPIDPSVLGLTDFTQVSTDADSELYYASLASCYGVTKLEPPPTAKQTLSWNYQAGAKINQHDFLIPDGYQASHAYVTAQFINYSDPVSISLIIGRTSITVSDTEPQQSIPLNQESNTLAASFSIPQPLATTNSNILLTVEIDTETSSHNLQSWQIATYQQIIAGYQKQLKEYYAAADAGLQQQQSRNPETNKAIINRALKADITQILIDRSNTLTDNQGNLFIGHLRYSHFLEQAFEWDEIYYTLKTPLNASQETTFDALNVPQQTLTDFLQAQYARVLLPVDPAFTYIVPYFLDSGIIWDGQNDLSLVNTGSVSVINKLKNHTSADQAEPAESSPPETWEIRIPTAMRMLQADSELPGIKS